MLWEANVTRRYVQSLLCLHLSVLCKFKYLEEPLQCCLQGMREAANCCFQATARTSQTMRLFFSLSSHGIEASVIMVSPVFCCRPSSDLVMSAKLKSGVEVSVTLYIDSFNPNRHIGRGNRTDLFSLQQMRPPLLWYQRNHDSCKQIVINCSLHNKTCYSL